MCKTRLLTLFFGNSIRICVKPTVPHIYRKNKSLIPDIATMSPQPEIREARRSASESPERDIAALRAEILSHEARVVPIGHRQWPIATLRRFRVMARMWVEDYSHNQQDRLYLDSNGKSTRKWFPFLITVKYHKNKKLMQYHFICRVRITRYARMNPATCI